MSLYDLSNIFNTYETKDGFQFYDLSNSINIEGDIDPSLYINEYIYNIGDWYTLAHKHYGNVKLWWVALIVNKIKNPFEIQSGQRIKILKKEIVSEILSQINNS